MSISSNSLTWAQFAQLSNDPAIQGVTKVLIDNESIFARDVPFSIDNTFTQTGSRWTGNNMPTVTWTTLNSAPTVPAGTTPEPFSEEAFLIRQLITTDRKYLRAKNQLPGTNAHAFQVSAFLTAMTYDQNHKFFNGKHVGTGADAKSIVGIRERLDNASDFGIRSENKINGGGVDLTTASATAATFSGTFCEYMDQLLWSVGSPTGEGVTLYMNAPLKRRISSLARRFSGQGGFGTATDQLGRMVETYKGAFIREAGRKSDQSTEIITSTETSGGADGNSNYTSVYAVRFGGENLRGWLFDPFTVKPDCDHADKETHFGTFIEWHGGIYYQSTRAIARLYGIKVS